MHELSIAAEILRITRASARERKAGRVEEVIIAVGDLSSLEPDLLVYAWEALTSRGPEDGARLLVQWRPARQRCPICGQEKTRSSGSWLRVCPDCGSFLMIDGGADLEILEIACAGDERRDTTTEVAA